MISIFLGMKINALLVIRVIFANFCIFWFKFPPEGIQDLKLLVPVFSQSEYSFTSLSVVLPLILLEFDGKHHNIAELSRNVICVKL